MRVDEVLKFHLVEYSTWPPTSEEPPSSVGPPPTSSSEDAAMTKMACSFIIYFILANENPEEFPLPKETTNCNPISCNPISTYTFENGACTFDDTVSTCAQSGDDPEQCTESTVSKTFKVQNCDCSDPKKYNFQDKGRFKILQDWIEDKQVFLI